MMLKLNFHQKWIYLVLELSSPSIGLPPAGEQTCCSGAETGIIIDVIYKIRTSTVVEDEGCGMPVKLMLIRWSCVFLKWSAL